MKLTIGDLKRLIEPFSEDNDAVIRMGCDAERFDYLEAIGFDNDVSTLILYTEKEVK